MRGEEATNMLGECRDCTRPWVRFVYNHNPFYVISAALVLYGLHVSFAGKLDPTEGWKFTQLLMAYMLMLAATSVVVVRLGQVWEDARTLVLLISLLMVALASSFDRVCLDDAWQGAKFLATGLTFSLLVSELLLRLLRLRLPWTYRLPFYSLLSLLFAYPAWLGHLSLENRITEMSWYVLGFPTVAGLLFALLAPAARSRGRNVTNNGTPWGWPLYPWSLFVVLGVGVLLRAYAISMSFDPTKGLASGFQLYVVIPLLLSWLLLWSEGADYSKPGRKLFAVVAPFGLIALALPGQGGTAAETRYLELLQDTLSSPMQITAALLIAYFVYIWSRGIRLAEAGLILTLGVLTIVDKHTVSLHTLAAIQAAPVLAAFVLLVIGSIWNDSAARMGAAAILVIAALWPTLHNTAFMAFHGYVPIHLAFFAIMLLGLMFHDWLGRHIAQAAAIVLASASVVVLAGYRFLFPDLPATAHAALTFGLAATAAAYWVKNRQFADLTATATCLAVSISLLAEHFIGSGLTYLVLQGRRWIAWGVVFFLAGLAVSLAKGGQFRQLRRALMRLHLTLRGSNRST
jgi:hypothetical protein